MSAKDQPTEEELRFLKEMGMTEVEPGRWSSAWQGSGPGMQEWLDDLGDEGEEQLDLLMRAGRVENEFKMEQGGAGATASVQRITTGPLVDAQPLEDHTPVDLAVFAAIRDSSTYDLDDLKGDDIEATLDQVREEYPLLTPADAIAVALRKLGIKSKAIRIDAHTAGPDEGPNPRDYPGFRAVLLHFPGARRIWLD
ncbi:hypothetical protein NG697_12640 [Pseudarthrobacter sp. MDT3-26]|uniref:hypothetical protein n=1 Tax=Pseudarthrobacter raffinosi TaxID=2953651 RepID=UPI00208FE495|nr:hypothetical protein [Pseudarthrobacter sp. MDT3-26]MCO4263759.1 hypothetical protein [Pseudarthrobacter sp. MDT3-26]